MCSLVKAHLDSEKRTSFRKYDVQCIWLQLSALCLSRFVRVLRYDSDLTHRVSSVPFVSVSCIVRYPITSSGSHIRL